MACSALQRNVGSVWTCSFLTIVALSSLLHFSGFLDPPFLEMMGNKCTEGRKGNFGDCFEAS